MIYTTTAPLGWLWTRVEAPAPSLPLPPASFQRLWRLPPEFSPFGESRLRRLPGAGEGRIGGRRRLPTGRPLPTGFSRAAFILVMVSGTGRGRKTRSLVRRAPGLARQDGANESIGSGISRYGGRAAEDPTIVDRRRGRVERGGVRPGSPGNHQAASGRRRGGALGRPGARGIAYAIRLAVDDAATRASLARGRRRLRPVRGGRERRGGRGAMGPRRLGTLSSRSRLVRHRRKG